jgi:sterol 3beta-glucosyltransferase
MQMCVDNGMFTVAFLKEGLQKFRGWLDDLLNSSWKACQGSDLLIESPSAMGGIHIAEALRIPYYRAFTACFFLSNGRSADEKDALDSYSSVSSE